jgi:diguanylate cyclase (GGDEF)-like protein
MDVMSIVTAMGFVTFFMIVTFIGLSTVSKGERFIHDLIIASFCFFLSTFNAILFISPNAPIIVIAVSNGFYMAGHAAVFSAVCTLIYGKDARKIVAALGLFVFAVHFIPNFFDTAMKRVFLLYPLVFIMSVSSFIMLYKNRTSELGKGFMPLLGVFGVFALILLVRGGVFALDDRKVMFDFTMDHYFQISGVLSILSFYFLLTVGFSIVLSWKKELRLRELANTDALTGWLNRKTLEQNLSLIHARTKRTNQAYGLVIIDIDKFKTINDTYGHAAGDNVIAEVSRLTKEHSRDYDLTFRMGGEEFLIVADNVSEGALQSFSERVRAAIEQQPFALAGFDRKVTVSMGGAISTHNDKDWHDVLERADKALYKAKQTGRNRVCFFDNEMLLTQ